MRLTGQDPALLRRINSAAALAALHSHESLTLSEIARLVGVSRRTAEEVVDEHVSRGWVAEVPVDPQRPRAVGRPARRFRFRVDRGFVVGLDIGARSVSAAVADLSGTVLAEADAATTPAVPRLERLGAAAEVAQRALASAGVDPQLVVGAGVASTGIITADGVVELSTRIDDWTGVDLAGVVQGQLGCPVRVENDCNVAAIAEHWLGTTRDVPDVVYVQTGPQLGAGILLGGRIHRGRHAAAGEINALPQLGWSELRDQLDELQPVDGAPAPKTRPGSLRRAAVDALIERFADRLAVGIAAMVLTIDPDAVVIGGTMAEVGSALSVPLARSLAEWCERPVRVEVSTLGERAVVLGAVRIALDEVERKLFAVDSQLIRLDAGS
jgi:predicted NBD/HSP70 family sugar kinase